MQSTMKDRVLEILNKIPNHYKDIQKKDLFLLMQELHTCYEEWRKIELSSDINGIKNDIEIDLNIIPLDSFNNSMIEKLFKYLTLLKQNPATRPEPDYKGMVLPYMKE